jgi:hypothetical protein
MKAYLGVEVYLHTFLTSALDRSEWPASRPGHFTPRERVPGTHWIGGWVGPRAVLEAVVKRKIPSPRRESNPRTPIVHPVVSHYTGWAITESIGILYPPCGWMTRFRILAWAEKSFFRHRFQIGSGAHPASYAMGTGGPFRGEKVARAWSWPLTYI